MGARESGMFRTRLLTNLGGQVRRAWYSNRERLVITDTVQDLTRWCPDASQVAQFRA